MPPRRKISSRTGRARPRVNSRRGAAAWTRRGAPR